MTALDPSPAAAGETAEDFGKRMVAALDNASLAILLSVGHQTGLLDAMAGLPPATSAQIADASGLNERYVREWLGGMTTG
ncbi:MAG: methyltransferase, partial [Mycobacterium sp.]